MRGRDTWVLVATIVGSSLAFIDGAVVTLALPQIQRDFSASAGDVAWIVELYALVIGSLMLLAGALADRYGRKRIFTTGTVLFAAGSIGCAFAWSIPSMLAMRVLQALGGMLLAPASLAIIGAHFSGEARGRAIAAWSAFSALTASLGPMAGGVLIDALGWRSVFWINIPLVAVVLYATIVHVGESVDENAPRHLDYFGAFLTVVGLGGLTYALLSSPQTGWTHPLTLGALVAGILALGGFAVHERRANNPLLPPDLFKSRTFVSVNAATLFLYGALGGIMYELPFVMIQGHRYTALQAAFGTVPFILCIVVLSRAGSSLAARIGTRATLTIGPALVAAGFALTALLHRNAPYLTSFLPGLLVSGIGMGLTVAPLTNSAIASARGGRVGIASGVSNTVARVAGLLAVAALTAVLAATYVASLERRLDTMHVTSAQRSEAARESARLGGAQFKERNLQDASQHAFADGFTAVAFVCSALALLAAALDALGVRDNELKSA